MHNAGCPSADLSPSRFVGTRSAHAISESRPAGRPASLTPAATHENRRRQHRPRQDRGQQVHRPAGAAARGPAAGDGARPLRRRHLVSAPASHADRARRRSPMAGSSPSTPRRRGRCRASSRCGPRPTSPTCRRSISAKAASSGWSRTASRCSRPTACAMSASPSPRCSPPIPTSRRMPPTSSSSRSPNCRCCSTPMRSPASSRRAATPSRPSCARATATSTPCSRAPRPWSNSISAVGRHSGVPLETRGAIGRYDASRDILELHGAAKVPHRNRDLLAHMLRRSPSSIHVHEAHVGGGFGIRGEIYPEDVLVCVAAMRLGRPVKWIEDRREHLVCANHSRQQRHKIRAALDAEGRILALDDEFWHDQGAYVRTHAIRVPMMICGILPGPYRVPAYRSLGHFRLTNKTPAATYRAPGRYETTFIRERLIDAIAVKLGIDPIEVRRRNAITAAEMPYPRPLEALGEEIHFDTGDYMGLLETVLAAASWDDAAGRSAAPPRRRRTGRRRHRHVRREERARAVRRRQDRGRHLRRGRGDHRRRLDRPGLRDRDGAGRGRDDRRRHRARARDPRPDRPHRVRHRRPCLARDRDDGLGDAGRGAEAARQGARHGGAAHAGRARRSRHRRRHRRRKDGSGASISLGAVATALLPTSKTLAGREPGPCRRGLVRRRAAGLSLWQPRRRGEGRCATPAASPSSATSSATTSAAPSIRCWSRARSSAASRKGWAAR